MKKAIYSGSFNPFHVGHDDILRKAIKVYDVVYVVQLLNLQKHDNVGLRGLKFMEDMNARYGGDNRVVAINGGAKTLKHWVEELKVDAVVRGLRDGDDLAHERRYQYVNEDLGIEVPFTLFLSDRKFNHVSSSVVREVEKLGLQHNYY